jgi:Uncharacterized conserved protein
MGLSLTAEQKELLKIFKIEEQYIVPAYQRPYSWEYDQCFQLYNDLIEAYESNEDYFIGNIIIAKSDANKDVLEIIDGQQRLITLLLLIKVLYKLQPELKILHQILEQEDWEGTESKLRIKSEIFEAKDESDLNKVLKYSDIDIEDRYNECSDKNGKILDKKCLNRFEQNLLYFYSWVLFYSSNNSDIKEFISFLLKRVFLLPIELTGRTQEEANEKALVIFETINNRGMNLEDADIFKAKLYKKAKKVKEEDVFIDLWVDFKHNCENLGLKIDDIFRYYSHIIRGKEGITSSEINLREFFIREQYSPFELKKYKEILDDLFKIIEILEFVDQQKHEEHELAIWLQIIEAYTNQYPKFAVVTYLFSNGFDVDKKLINFLKSLVRFIYYSGSTSSVKFEIYTIIKQISLQQTINSYLREVSIEYFDYLGRLKYGYALLAFYIFYKKPIAIYYVDKLINYKDKNYLTDGWQNVLLANIVDSLGNYIILDIPQRSLSFDRKGAYYMSSKIKEVREIFVNGFTYEQFIERDRFLKEKLVTFFIGAE